MTTIKCPKCKRSFQLSEAIENQILSQADQSSATKILMLEKQLKDQKEQLRVAQRKLDQGSQQLQGEVRELQLEATLREAFPWDDIEEVKSGANGADVRQLVRPHQESEGVLILWECKNTIRWSNLWVQKLKDDMRSAGAPIGVIVSDNLPRGIDSFGECNGVFVCRARYVKQLAGLLRTIIERETTARMIIVGRATKAERLYDYLTSNVFVTKMRLVLDTFGSMQENINRQKRSMTTLWTQQERQIETIALELAGLSGDVLGIAGSDATALERLALHITPEEDVPQPTLVSSN
jgi:hypothetical protein